MFNQLLCAVKTLIFVLPIVSVLVTSPTVYAQTVQGQRPNRFLVPGKSGKHRWGLVDNQGHQIAPPIYKSIYFSQSVADPILVKGENDKWGYLTAQGKVLHEINLQDAFTCGDEGIARFLADGKWGFLLRDGSYLVNPIYDEVRAFKYGYAAVRQNEAWHYINTKGELAFERGFAKASDFGIAGLAAVKSTNGEKVGVINQQGDWIVQPTFDDFNGCSANGHMLVKANDHWGVLNRQGKWVAKPQFDRVRSFSSIDSLPVEINEKWGVIDREGKWLVQPRYYSIRGFNNLDTAIYSTAWDQHGLMDAQGNTLTDDSYHPADNFKIASDFQLVSFEGYSRTSFFSPRGARPIEKLNAHKVGTLSGFNRSGLSIANLASNSEWGLLSVEGNLFKFDTEVIEPYFSDDGDCFGFTATNSAFLPAINRKRDLVYVDSKGKIAIRTKVLKSDTTDTFVVQRADGEELWRHEFPGGSLAQKHRAFLNISDLELGYTTPTVANAKELVKKLFDEKPYAFDPMELYRDEDCTAYGNAHQLARAFWSEFNSMFYSTMVSRARPNLDEKFSAYQKALSSIYGDPIKDPGHESVAFLENNEVLGWEQSVWLINHHLLVLNTQHSDGGDDTYDYLNLLLLPTKAAAGDALGLPLKRFQDVSFAQKSSESVQAAIENVEDKLSFSSALGLQKAVTGVFALLDKGEAISKHDYLRTQHALLIAAYYDSSEQVFGTAEEYIAISENTMRFLEQNGLGQNRLTDEGQYKIDVYRYAGNGAAWLLHEDDPARALKFIEPTTRYITDKWSYLWDALARSQLNAGQTDKGYATIHKVLSENPWYEYFEEFYEDEGFIKWRKAQGHAHPENYEVPSSSQSVRYKQDIAIDGVGKQLAISWFDQIKVVDLTNGSTIFEADHGTYDPFFLGFGAKDSRLIASGWDHFYIWDIRQAKPVVKQLLADGDNSSFVTLSKAGKHYAYTSGDLAPTLQMKAVPQEPAQGTARKSMANVRHAVASKDGELIAAKDGAKGVLSILDTSTQTLVAELRGDGAENYDSDFFFVNQNKKLLVRNTSGGFSLWNIKDQKVEHTWVTDYGVEEMAISDNLLVIIDDELKISTWDLAKTANEKSIDSFKVDPGDQSTGEVSHISISKDGAYYAFSVANKLENLQTIYVVDRSTQKIASKYTTELSCWSARFANNDRYLVIDSYPIEVIDWRTSKVIHRFSR